MRILVTNDDGIMAPGLQALAQKVSELGDVIVVAPDSEKSATGHGITVWEPIRIKKVKLKGINEAWAVSGTPADCVKLAVQEFVGEECNLVMSGINNGANLGTDVLYSGTVSAAIEGIILGYPSIAVSLASQESYDNDFSTAAEIALILGKHLCEKKEILPPDTLLNVNVPAVKREELKGFRVTRLGVREYENVFDKRIDPRGNTYYWLKGDLLPYTNREADIDIVAVEENYISVSPIHFDLTNYRIINEIKKSGFESLRLPF